MAGHVDVSVVMQAPLAVAWRVTNDFSQWDSSTHRLLERSEDGRRISFELTAPFGGGGRTWTYRVDRWQEPDGRLVFARRSQSPHLVYSVAWWLYDENDGVTTLRTVQDFQMSETSPIDDRRMEELLSAGTLRSMQKTAERVAAAAQLEASGHVTG